MWMGPCSVDGRRDSLWQRVSGCGMVDRLIRVHAAWLMKLPGADLWHWVPFRGSVLRQLRASSYICCLFIVYRSNNQYTKVAHSVTLQQWCARIYPELESSRVCSWGKFLLQLRGWPVLTPGQQPQYWKIGTPRIGVGKQEQYDCGQMKNEKNVLVRSNNAKHTWAWAESERKCVGNKSYLHQNVDICEKIIFLILSVMHYY